MDATATVTELRVCRLGAVPYRDAIAIQADLQTQRQADETPRHAAAAGAPARLYPRAALGRRASSSLGEDFYRAQGIEIVPTDRGGRVTYHGPGQLVGYPIMRVEDIGAHLRTMEAAIVAALARVGHRSPLALRGGHRLHRRVGGGAQDRLDRRARLARRLDARVRDQRRSTTSSRSRGSCRAACPT